MKNKKVLEIVLILALLLTGCAAKDKETEAKESADSITKVSTTTTQSSSTTNETTIATTVSEEREFAIAGNFYTPEGQTAEVKEKETNEWVIAYPTADGNVTAEFTTKWVKKAGSYYSKTPMKKSDGNSDFNIEVQYQSPQKVTITMTDGKADHEMKFSTEKPAKSIAYDAILEGDLSSFAGQFSNDSLEKSIADADFTLYAYSPDEYYRNETSVFPTISENEGKWMYWSGAMHASYKINRGKAPEKINDYYEVYFLGENAIAIKGQEFTLTLVPPDVKGPDGSYSDEKRVFYGMDKQVVLREYHDDWWKSYKTADGK